MSEPGEVGREDRRNLLSWLSLALWGLPESGLKVWAPYPPSSLHSDLGFSLHFGSGQSTMTMFEDYGDLFWYYLSMSWLQLCC